METEPEVSGKEGEMGQYPVGHQRGGYKSLYICGNHVIYATTAHVDS